MGILHQDQITQITQELGVSSFEVRVLFVDILGQFPIVFGNGLGYYEIVQKGLKMPRDGIERTATSVGKIHLSIKDQIEGPV